MAREDKLRGVNLDKKMSLREYRQFAEGKFGKSSVNNDMMRSMDRSLGGTGKAVATVDQLNKLNAGIKIKSNEGR